MRNMAGSCHSRPGPLNRGTDDTLGWMIPCCGGFLCIEGCFATTLDPSTKCPQQHPHPQYDNQNASRHRPMSPRSQTVPSWEHCSREWGWREDFTFHLSYPEPYFIFFVSLFGFTMNMYYFYKKKNLVIIFLIKGKKFPGSPQNSYIIGGGSELYY